MPSSELGWYEDFDPGRVDANRPAGAGHFRRLIGNIDHLADQAAQRRVNWWPISGIYFAPEETSITAGIFYRCWQSCPFDLHVVAQNDPDTGEIGALSSYGLRVRLHAAISTGSALATFRVVVAGQGLGRAIATASSITAPNVAEASTASTTAAWLTPGPAVISLDEDAVDHARQTVTVQNVVGGVDDVAQWLRCTAEVWASTANASSVPRVSGLIVDEYFTP